jgi:superfamily II DNA helicase RecQ
VVGIHSAWSTIFLLCAPSVSALSATYGPHLRDLLSNYFKADVEDRLKKRVERKTKERPIKKAKKKIKVRLQDPALSHEKRTALIKAMESLDDIDLANILEQAGIKITSVTIESGEQD